MKKNSDLQDDLERFDAEVMEFRIMQQLQQAQLPPKLGSWMLLSSLALFVAVYAIPGFSRPQSGLTGIAILVGVLFLHEMGHFLAMQWFGYQNISMIFLPGFGAAVTGYKDDATLAQRIWMLLAGPLPGILLGIGIAIAIRNNPWNAPSWIIETSWMLIVINILNLLPIYPLDGGKIANLLLHCYPGAEVWLKIASVIVLVGFGIQDFPLLLIALLVGVTIPGSFRVARLYRQFHKFMQQCPSAGDRPIHVSFKVVSEHNHKIVGYEQKHRWVKDLVQRYRYASRQTTRLLLSILYIVSVIGSFVGTYQAYMQPGWQIFWGLTPQERELLKGYSR